MSYRFYSFVNNLYMSPIQLGIQTAHAATNMSIAYGHEDTRYDMYVEWASTNPVIMICQGHNVAGLQDLASTLGPLAERLILPFTTFNEDQASLGGVITAVAVLVPERLAGLKHKMVRSPEGDVPEFFNEDGTKPQLTEDELALVKIVKLARLA